MKRDSLHTMRIQLARQKIKLDRDLAMKRDSLHTMRIQLARQKIKHARVFGEQDCLLPFRRNRPHTRHDRALLARQPADVLHALHPELRVVGREVNSTDTSEDRHQVARLLVIARRAIPIGELVSSAQVRGQMAAIPVDCLHLKLRRFDLDATAA